jgi:hypothetical protein
VALLAWERRAAAPAGAALGSAHPGLIGCARAVATACFAWIGYAAGALLSARLVRRAVDLHRAAGDVRTQLMFVVAFVANTAAVLAYERWWRPRRPPVLSVFLAFWALDTLVPWAYQALVLHPSRPHFALLLGFVPAVVITLGVRLGRWARP